MSYEGHPYIHHLRSVSSTWFGFPGVCLALGGNRLSQLTYHQTCVSLDSLQALSCYCCFPWLVSQYFIYQIHESHVEHIFTAKILTYTEHTVHNSGCSVPTFQPTSSRVCVQRMHLHHMQAREPFLQPRPASTAGQANYQRLHKLDMQPPGSLELPRVSSDARPAHSPRVQAS